MARRISRLLKCIFVVCSIVGCVLLFSQFADDRSVHVLDIGDKNGNSDTGELHSPIEVGEWRQINPKLLIDKNRRDEWVETNELSKKTDPSLKQANLQHNQSLNYNVHAFYYSWYGNPKKDRQYFHWNHEYLPHWDKKISAKFPTGQAHVPPDDIGSSFYPLLGTYSSLDEEVVRRHAAQMQEAGIGVLALSWYPPGQADDHGQPVESFIPTLFDIVNEFDIKVCFHIEPYRGRTPESVRNNLEYILDTYGRHPAFHRYTTKNGEKLPFLYIYDSYLTSSDEWKRLLTKGGDLTIRNTKLDALLVGLLVERKHMSDLARSGFDGLYTYFAADGFSYGSTRRRWKEIAKFSESSNILFIPSIGPGYDDTKVRPWNSENSRQREGGAYYEEGWKMATSAPGVNIVSITSFNEWHEGTQIEPASSESMHGRFSYLTYQPFDPDYYLKATKKWSSSLLSKELDLT